MENTMSYEAVLTHRQRVEGQDVTFVGQGPTLATAIADLASRMPAQLVSLREEAARFEATCLTYDDGYVPTHYYAICLEDSEQLQGAEWAFDGSDMVLPVDGGLGVAGGREWSVFVTGDDGWDLDQEAPTSGTVSRIAMALEAFL